MKQAENKLKVMHNDLLGTYNQFSLFSNIYILILIYKKTKKERYYIFA